MRIDRPQRTRDRQYHVYMGQRVLIATQSGPANSVAVIRAMQCPEYADRTSMSSSVHVRRPASTESDRTSQDDGRQRYPECMYREA